MNQMKRIIALALSLVFVFAGFATVYATAAEQAAKLTKGDVNANGKIDMTDYILTKRAYFNTFTLDEEQLDRADINNNGKLDMTDYILLKRIYFGTYPIPVTPEEPEEDTSSDVSEDVSEDVSSDVSEDVSSDVSEDVSSDVSEDVSSDVSEDVSSDVSEDVSSDVSEDTSSDVTIPTDDEVDPDVSEDTSSDDTSSDDTSSDDTSSDDEEPALGTYDNPYLANLGAMRIAVTLEPGAEAYVKADDSDGNILKVGYGSGAEYFAVYCRQTINPEGEDNAMSITMNADVDFVYFMNTSETETIVLYIVLEEGTASEEPAGTMDNPIEITLSEMFGALRGNGEGEAAAGGQGVYFKVVAPADGLISVFPGASDAEFNALDWVYSVNNETAGKYGDQHWSDDEEVVNNEMVKVSEGDVVIIFVNTYNPADMWGNPAGTVSASVSFAANGSSACPEEITAGDYTASVDEGSQGYYYTYIAAEDGTVTLTIADTNTVGWTYSLGNKTQSIFNDTRYSDDDPAFYSDSIAVKAGDVVDIMINTYDPDDMWSNPEGEIAWSLSFKDNKVNVALEKTYTYSSNDLWLQSWCQTGTAIDTALTNGVKGSVNYYTAEYVGWNATAEVPLEIVVDLNCYASVSKFNLSTMEGIMGIACPSDISISVSNDNAEWTPVTTTVENIDTTLDSGWGDVGLNNRLSVLSADEAVEARYVKFTITPVGLFIWAEEIEVFGVVTGELDNGEGDDSSDVTIPTDDEVDPDVSDDTSSDDTSSDVEEPALGTYDNPYLANLGAMRIAVTLEPGAEAYVKADDSDGNILKVGYATAADYAAYYCRQQYNPEGEDNAMAITMNADVDFVCFMNSSETETIVLYIVLEEGAASEEPAGTMDDPIEITLSEMFGALRGNGEAEAAAGGQGIHFKVVAPADGLLVISAGAVDAEYNMLDYMYFVNNVTAGIYGDTQFSDDVENFVYMTELNVSAGDEIIICVNTYNPDDMWGNPAGTVSANVSFAASGSSDCPKEITEGDYTASVAAGSEGCYYTYIAAEDGIVTLTIANTNTVDWTYSIGNKTQSIYNDARYSDEDPILYSDSIAVKAGDVVDIMICTYNIDEVWTTLEGEIAWSLSFAADSEDTSSDASEDTSSDVSEEPVVNPESNVVNVWNANYSASTDAIIFTDADAYAAANIGWWRHVAFAPVEGKTGIYKVVAISSGDAGASGGLTIPENGFIWCAYEWPAAGSIGANVIAIMNLLAVGTTIEVTGIDIAAGTNTADANIAIWVDPTTPGIISMGSSYTASIETYWTMDGQGVSTKPTTALTDGIKGTNDFWRDAYVCYSGVAWATGVSITVDLEDANNLTSFNAYCLAPGMGINVPSIGETLTKIEIYDAETSTWVEVDCTVTDTVESFTDGWGNAVARHLYTFTVNGEPVVSSQVRFTLSAWGQFLMLDEVEVIGYAAN